MAFAAAAMGHSDPLPIYLYNMASGARKAQGYPILSTPIQATICNDQTQRHCLTKLHVVVIPFQQSVSQTATDINVN